MTAGDNVATPDAHQRVLDATLAELLDGGLSQIRLKRVAQRARVSIGLISDHFGDREGLINATILDRSATLLSTLFDRLNAVPDDPDHDELWLREFESQLVMTDDSERQNPLLELVELTHLVSADARATEQLNQMLGDALRVPIERARRFVDGGGLATGINAAAFLRVVVGVACGQSILEGIPELKLTDNEWVAALGAVMRSVLLPFTIDLV